MLIATTGAAWIVAPGGSAQLPGGTPQLPGGSPQLPSVPVTTPTLPAVPVQTPSLPPTPKITPVPKAAPAPSLPAPSLPAPSLPAPSLPSPSVPSPSGGTRSLQPAAPSPGGSAPSPAESLLSPAGSVLSPAGSQGGTSGSRLSLPGGTALFAAGGSAQGAGPGGTTSDSSTAAMAGIPAAVASRIALPGSRRPKGVSRKEWRKMLKRFWDTPLKGKRLRHLRETLLSHWSCADTLSSTSESVLLMRAGLFGRTPAARTTIARRLGITLRRTVRAELTGIQRLARAGTCIEAGGAALGTNLDSVSGVGSAVDTTAVSARGDEKKSGDREPDQQGVLGVSESHSPLTHLRGGEEGRGTLDTLLAFLAVLLVVLLVATTAIGGAHVVPVMAAARRVSRKPLLFLDIDGVIALRPAERSLPAGSWEPLGSTNTYISTSAVESVRMLTEQFEVVWASDWEEMANPFFRKRLGLSEDLPALTFHEGTDDPKSSEWKIARIEEMAGDRPLAWVDGTGGRAHRRWAGHRSAPTLVVCPEPSFGLSDEDVAELCEFAASVADYDARRGVVRRVRHPKVMSR